MLREIENIHHDASLLKEQMNLVKEDIRVVKGIFLTLKTYLWTIILKFNFTLVQYFLSTKKKKNSNTYICTVQLKNCSNFILICIYFKVEENTAQSMKMLMEIDTVKTRMQDASRALKVQLYLFNNCIAKWRLGAQDIPKLALLAASS